MDIIEGFFRIIGSLICHQLPSRTIYLQGCQLPMCARDTGIYIGIFISLAYSFCTGKFKSDRPPHVFTSVILCLIMLPMMADGVTSYMGIRSTTNEIRLFTGIFFGIPIPFLLIPAANFRVEGSNKSPSLRNNRELLLPLLMGLLCGVLIAKTGLVPWIVVSSATSIAFVFLIWRIVFTIAVRAKVVSKGAGALVAVSGITLGVLGILFLISHFVLQPLKHLLIK
ncbi:putative membrane protein [Anaerobacterium chartisolvens]|uniref:Putative membrane protein n=1 Tax=Anaerobacterium chartisolvens TaxID=1297424 RepID=A0A369AMW5_9FIRM|nr:DUF2085 domain-containing protein [Anaerobacterium chartisolvens]RCX10521.1 putative membrane protein [Anaerobacterium chartisolvens]